MNARISYLVYKVRTGFWFLPAAFMIMAIILAQASLWLDGRLQRDRDSGIDWLFQVGPEGSRLFLSTIAGSMMTVTSLVFSLTLITLTMASSQFGPRLITSFVRDRLNQIVLGVFLATFVYALLVLRAIHQSETTAFVPQVSIAVSLVLAIASFGVLIFFIHHVSDTIQADTIIAGVADDLNQSIRNVCREIEESGDGNDAAHRSDTLDFDVEDGVAVKWDRSGYVQAFDYGKLVSIAFAQDIYIRLHQRAGHFVVTGDDMAILWPRSRVTSETERELHRSVVVGGKRTIAQDVEFALSSLVEIALRALSPGINDPYTAIACIDYMSEALVFAAGRDLPSGYLQDEEGGARVYADSFDYGGLLDTAFNEIRQIAPGNVAVLARMVEALDRIARFARDDAQRSAIQQHADRIERAFKRTLEESNDRDDIERRLRTLRSTLSGE